MFATVAAVALLGFALAWTALNKSGVSPNSWYVSLILIGLATLAYWSRARRVLCPPLPAWLVWTIRGLFLYMLFQLIPLPLGVLNVLSPARAELTRALAPVLGPVRFAPISVDPAADLLWLLTIAGSTAAFSLVREFTFRLQTRLYVAFLPLLLVATFEALLGLLQVASGAVEAVGSYNSRDHYCCILEMTLPISIALGMVFFSRKTFTPTIWPVFSAVACWIAAGLLMLGTLFSLSRAGWLDSLVSLSVLTSLILFPRIRSNTRRLSILGGLLVAFFALFLFASPTAMLGRLAGGSGNDYRGRIFIWRALQPLPGQFRWFGAGLMGFEPIFLKYQSFVSAKRVDFAHNDFLQYLIELGLVGFLPLMLSLGAIIWPVLKNSYLNVPPSSERAELRVLLVGCLAGVSALFLHSLVDFNMYIPANMFAFAWILGIGSAMAAVFNLKTSDTPVLEGELE